MPAKPPNTPRDLPPDLPDHEETVHPDWVDFNGHMNVAYYVMAFDHAVDSFLNHIGIGEDYREDTGHSVFVVEAHITYEHELHAGDGLRIITRVLGHDEKRLQVFQHMYRMEGNGGGNGDNRGEPGALAATNELMFLHVNLESRRTAAFPEQAKERITRLNQAQSALPRPAQAGRAIGLKPKPSAAK